MSSFFALVFHSGRTSYQFPILGGKYAVLEFASVKRLNTMNKQKDLMSRFVFYYAVRDKKESGAGLGRIPKFHD